MLAWSSVRLKTRYVQDVQKILVLAIISETNQAKTLQNGANAKNYVSTYIIQITSGGDIRELNLKILNVTNIDPSKFFA